MVELLCPRHGIHQWLPYAARILSFRDLDDQGIFNQIFALTRDARRPVREREINDAISLVRGTKAQSKANDALHKLSYQPETLERFAGRYRDVVDARYLALRSKFMPHNRSPAGFLHKLYRPGEKVVVFDVFESQGCYVWAHPGRVGDLSTLNYLQSGRDGVWHLCNPVDGEFHWNPRAETMSRRSQESVISFRYAVIESDQADSVLWLKALVRLPLPIAAIYSSGGQSIHCLIVVNATSKARWDEIVRGELGPILVRLGACACSLSAVRLSRLPNCLRGQTGRLQELFYLDDRPDDTPIADKALRDPDTLRSTWGTTFL